MGKERGGRWGTAAPAQEETSLCLRQQQEGLPPLSPCTPRLSPEQQISPTALFLPKTNRNAGSPWLLPTQEACRGGRFQVCKR